MDFDFISQVDKVTPLLLASLFGRSKVVKYLLQEDADPNIESKNKDTGLQVACFNGHEETVKIILHLCSKEIDVNVANNEEGNSALHHAAFKGELNIVKILIKHNANVNLPNAAGETPLYIACEEGFNVMVKLLIEMSADINQPNDEGKPPLDIAYDHEHPEIIKALLENGANLNVDENNRKFSDYFTLAEIADKISFREELHNTDIELLNSNININLIIARLDYNLTNKIVTKSSSSDIIKYYENKLPTDLYTKLYNSYEDLKLVGDTEDYNFGYNNISVGDY